MSEKPAKKWLISFAYTAVFYKADGRTSMVGPSDAFVLTEQHPAKFVATMNQAFDDVRQGGGRDSGSGRRGDMLHKINWSIEVPDGVLTEDEADLLS